jgi:histidinol-phosphate/aromatic aminotransferase/cobyric acid decarboxylase-like protein/choline kinase
VILTAGLGRRMRPLTETMHKTLIEVAPGQTILGRIVDSLIAAEVADIVVVTGYKSAEVRAFLARHYPEQHFDFVHNPRYETTNNIHSLALAFEAFDFSDGMLLIESDLIFERDLIQKLLDDPRENVALIDRFAPGMDGTVVTMLPDGRIDSVIPGTRQPEGFDFSDKYKTLNIYRFSGTFSQGPFARLLRFYAQEIDDNCYYELVLGMLIAVGHTEVHGHLVGEQCWAEVDDPADLDQARFLADPGTRRALLDRAWGGFWGLPILDFAFIRNMHYPTPAILAEMRMQLPTLIGCYGSSQTILDQKMAWVLRCDPANVVALNGASQAFPWIAAQCASKSVLIPAPTFGEWSRAFPHASTYEDLPPVLPDPASHIDDVEVIVLVNPNNPTGTTLRSAEVIELVSDAPEVLFLVDESFIDFSDEDSVIEAVIERDLRNVLVLKSLSKCLGVPGLRIGFAFSLDRALLADLRSGLPVWNMNSLAEKYLELVLKNREIIQDSYARTRRDRSHLKATLMSQSLISQIAPSGADFLLLELSVDADAAAMLADQLAAEFGVYVKDVSRKFPNGRGWWRIAVRTPADHDRLAEALAILEKS